MDINWKASTCTNIRRPKGVSRYWGDIHQGYAEGQYRIGEPIRWFNAISSLEAILGAATLILSWYLACHLDTGSFHFLWALVFSPLLREETALMTFPTRLVSATTGKIVIGVVDGVAHKIMIFTVAVVEVLYEIDSSIREIYTAVVSIFWACSLISCLLVHVTPFYRQVSPSLKMKCVDPVKTEQFIWNSLVTDPGATNGLRCGGKALYSGLALAPCDRVSDAGDAWAGEVGHTENAVTTIDMGKIVCVG